MNTDQNPNPFRCDPPWSRAWEFAPRDEDTPFRELPWFSDAWKLVPREDEHE